ncbi:type II secretion system protein GspE [Candidatus Berkelbacteria bacterium CG10_big_fil_rev_8_21_14_0_10_41_12]|uniref:Type II secretion system protein GspE n=1 Tax=Candidatus Berkelbacteria bacterium CG10_big_fil_rev_8_21_14_0_10_41_12 TaxID=1974513 RepID=A0A2M6WX95_9BACT|nr:MAG: type II secretion system protein GspE [Candidatus Berkelbacteria bacterium CG10_big_fil_rev_8_21_14_0_10_41_12]
MADLDKALKIFAREGEEKTAQDQAKKLGLPYVNLVGYPFTPQVLTVIPREQAEKFKTMAFYQLNRKVKVASPVAENPMVVNFLRELASAINQEFYLYKCSESSFRYAFAQLQFVREAPMTLDKLVVPQEYVTSRLSGAQGLQSIANKILQTSTTEIMEIIFAGAIKVDASDIHIEPEENDARLRYRIDGVLQDVAKLPKETAKVLTNRIKYIAKLKLDLSKRPQDGRFEVDVADQNIDVRLSTMPGAWGEVIVMRLLNPTGAKINLAELGFRADAMAKIEEAISKPHGAIFNTGPTGSGKTTTLYAILQKLNKPEVKIITLEDPIEYRIEGIDQSQISPEKGFDFANGLKHALRQDPDIIMIGEIRDKETAATALQAALTGHLVLTTLHTNSAPSSIPRLLDMGVDAFLLSGSINLIIAQRLVRKLCPTCRGEKQINSAPCVACNGTGYKGRVALVETMQITPRIEKLIEKKGTILEFEKAAREDGMITMFEDGLKKVKEGITAEEEVKRVTSADIG